MDKINFENLPSTNTPINQDNLNLMQSNIEKSVVAVGKTQPSTSENVWIKKGKNLFNNTFYQIRNGRVSNIRIESKKVMIEDKINIPQAITLSNDLDLNTYKWAVNIKTDRGTIDYDSDWINTNSWTVSQSEISEYVLRGNAEIYFVVAKIDDSDINVSEMDNYNFQIEVGTTATTLEPYVEKEILVKNNNGVFEEFYNEGKNVIEKINNSNGTALLFDDGTMICYGNVYSTNISWSTWGSIYSASISYTFPLQFVALPAVFCSVAGGTNTGNGWTGRPVHTTTGGTVEIYRPTSYGNTMSIDFMAIGNWKQS